ncbi:MAG: cation-translocating P-type ATPase, partial [Anaerolineales bacterium]|nr:cation-translocating P-type ATPase [Anaerolineales bacterium]
MPDIKDARDDCVARLEHTLENHGGIRRVHVKHEADPAQLCLHYDPNLISLAAVERVARDAGSRFTERYRHEAMPISGMTSADAAVSLADVLRNVPGMLHANVNYAAGLAFVAYDTKSLQRPSIHQTLRQMGYQPTPRPEAPPDEREAYEDHGRAPSFLPQWMRERWGMILVALAGLFFLIGWLGETFFSLPETIALIFFILAYITGGYDIASHAIPGLLKGKFDTDVLMLAAAAGAALLGEWAEGAFLL